MQTQSPSFRGAEYAVMRDALSLSLDVRKAEGRRRNGHGGSRRVYMAHRIDVSFSMVEAAKRG